LDSGERKTTRLGRDMTHARMYLAIAMRVKSKPHAHIHNHIDLP